MKRKCEKIISNPSNKVAIYVDSKNKQEIISYLYQDERHKKKFKFITDIILGGHRNTEIYDKEEINEKCKNVTAMKFFKGQENDRIYCKEISSFSGTHIIITSELYLGKKSNKLTKKEKKIIEKVGGYEYEI